MAVTINRLLADGAQFAGIEFCSTGDATGETGTIIDIGTLNDANGSGDERVRIKSIQALVASGDAANGSCTLSWGGSGDVFCTLPVGHSEVAINFEPTSGFNGDINYSLTDNVSVTLRIKLEKLHGFPNTAAKFINI